MPRGRYEQGQNDLGGAEEFDRELRPSRRKEDSEDQAKEPVIDKSDYFDEQEQQEGAVSADLKAHEESPELPHALGSVKAKHLGAELRELLGQLGLDDEGNIVSDRNFKIGGDATIGGDIKLSGSLVFPGVSTKGVYRQIITDATGGSEYDALVIEGNWDSAEIMGRVWEATGTDLHIGNGYSSVDHSSDKINIGGGYSQVKLNSILNVQDMGYIGRGGHGSNYLHIGRYSDSGKYAILASSSHTYLNSIGSGNIYFRNDNSTGGWMNSSKQWHMVSDLGVGVAPSSSYRIYATGRAYGIRAHGSTMGGRFQDSGGTSTAYCAYGVWGFYSGQRYYGGYNGTTCAYYTVHARWFYVSDYGYSSAPSISTNGIAKVAKYVSSTHTVARQYMRGYGWYKDTGSSGW